MEERDFMMLILDGVKGHITWFWFFFFFFGWGGALPVFTFLLSEPSDFSSPEVTNPEGIRTKNAFSNICSL